MDMEVVPALTEHSAEEGKQKANSEMKTKDKDHIVEKEEGVLLKDRATIMKGDLADGIDCTIQRYTDNDHNSNQLLLTDHKKTDIISEVCQLVSRHSQFSDAALVASSPKQRYELHLLHELVRSNASKDVEESARNGERQAELQNKRNSDARTRRGQLPPISS